MRREALCDEDIEVPSPPLELLSVVGLVVDFVVALEVVELSEKWYVVNDFGGLVDLMPRHALGEDGLEQSVREAEIQDR